MNNLHIVTVATERQYYFPYLVDSCERNGKKLEILGMGEEWQGFNWRFTKMINYLKTLPQNDIVCFVDGYDVVCCRNLKELPDVFLEIKKRTGCKIVVGHEKLSFLNGLLAYTYFGRCNNSYINAGTYIGTVNDLLEILPKIYALNPKDDADDQVLITKYCKQNSSEIYCDTKNQLFLTLVYSLREIDKFIEIDTNNNNNIIYDNNNPFFLHAAGNGYLDNVINKLGYSTEPNKIKNQLFYNFYKKVLLYCVEIFKTHIVFVIFLILIIIVFFNYSKIRKKFSLFTKSTKALKKK
jgi:hypothetical protein